MKKKSVVVIVIILIAFGFYWFGWRPSQIRKDCADLASHGLEILGLQGKARQEKIDWDYKQCLREKGL